MKKMIVLWTISISLYNSVKAQVFEEWFRQDETRKEYLLKQIAALKTYTGYVKEGMEIARRGLTTIGRIKTGDYNLHNDFFNSLKTVSPAIKNYSKVADIMFLQVSILKQYKKAIREVRECAQFDDEEIKYIHRVFSNLLSQCTSNIDELISLTTSDKLELKDDERVQRIDRLYLEMEDKFSFLRHFSNDTKILARQREKEMNDIKNSRVLYGIKK
jgi:hypothetical protein